MPSSSESQNIDVELSFDKNSARQYVIDQLDIGYRIPGTLERENCAQYFISKFKAINSNFYYVIHNFTIHSTDCQNILFKLNEDKENIVILGAHYDTRAKATKDDFNPNDPVPGANDGASGCAALIELANVLYERKEDLDCQIWFLFFDAEDQGKDNDYGIDGWDWCEGSTQFVNDIDNFYDSSKEDFDSMILLDMVGGTGLEFINEQYSTSSLLGELFETGRQLGYSDEFPYSAVSAYIIDDHKAFINAGIPSADLIIKFWNNPNWPYHHTTDDDISHISRHSLEVTGKTIEQFIYNNYLDIPSNDYKGNYPYNEDINIPSTEIIIFIILVSCIISATIITIYFIKRNALRKTIE